MNKRGNEKVNWFVLGESSYKLLIIIVFYAGLVAILGYSYLFMQTVSMVSPVVTTYMDNGAFTQRGNTSLAIIAGIAFFLVVSVVWKLVCEFILLIFEALRAYISSKKHETFRETYNNKF